MGCLFSREDEERDRSNYYTQTVSTGNQLPTTLKSYEYTSRVIQVHGHNRNRPLHTNQHLRRAVTHPSQVYKPQPEPLYGEFKCTCGRYWRSLLSWKDGYQVCKHCNRQVYPKNQRELRPSDRTRDKEDVGEHPKEYCQKCQQLGSYCGRFNGKA